MAYIRHLKAIEILDSRGYPTVEVHLTTDEGLVARASVPSGASTGDHEAHELRDASPERYSGKGVLTAVSHINGTLAQLVIGEHVFDQERLDQLLCAHDGTENKSRLGANAILAVSLAIARAGALMAKLPLYRYLGGSHAHLLPCPMMNILNGGVHADNGLSFQEFLIRPVGAPSFKEAIRWGSEIFQTLKRILQKAKLASSVGDEGGFAPRLSDASQALDLIVQAIEEAGFRPKEQITIALDLASSEFFDRSTHNYTADGKERSLQEHVHYLEQLCLKYPIDSIEDGCDQNRWNDWKVLTERLGNSLQLVGDDLFVTSPKRILKGIQEKIGNAVLIKLNQIGTVSETLEAIRLTQIHGYKAVISHRSGETDDTFIADLAVATNAGQIKTGAPCRGERVAKYNRLLHIEEGLGSTGHYAHSGTTP